MKATQFDNKINYQKKKKTKKKYESDIASISKDHRKFIKNNKSILKISKDIKGKGRMFLL